MYSPEKDPRALAAEAKRIMETRWNMKGVGDCNRPCRWYSEKYGNPRQGYRIEEDD